MRISDCDEVNRMAVIPLGGDGKQIPARVVVLRSRFVLGSERGPPLQRRGISDGDATPLEWHCVRRCVQQA